MLNLKPENKRRFFEIFEQLCAIPHGSGNTKKISDFCVDFANNLNLKVYQDELNNVVIIKPATFGYEDKEPIILQGHLDMVCEKYSDVYFDFGNDGLEIYVVDDYITANGTTLGGDDGIAIAITLAILEDKTLMHPQIEAVFTTDEETGMYGAIGLDTSVLKGKKLINIDSENEGVFTVSCAGGARTQVELPIEKTQNNLPAFEISIDGFLGGHSGVEIDKGRVNANIFLGQILQSFEFEFLLSDICGGLKDNAIPRSAKCVICCKENPEKSIKEFIEKNSVSTDNKPTCYVKETTENFCFTTETTQKIIYFLNNVLNGIQKMSSNIEGLVQTSLNLGILYCDDNKMTASFAVRSSVNLERDQLIESVKTFSNEIGASVSSYGFYPAWEYRKESILRDKMCENYKKLYGKEAIIEAIHAGLECGLFGEKINNLDAVSIGPDMCDIHTPKEKL